MFFPFQTLIVLSTQDPKWCDFRTLEDNLEGVKAKLSEYESSLESMEKGEVEERLSDSTRKIALLRSNEAIMVRRYQAVEESESMLRKENLNLKEEIVQIQNGIVEKLGALQRWEKNRKKKDRHIIKTIKIQESNVMRTDGK